MSVYVPKPKRESNSEFEHSDRFNFHIYAGDIKEDGSSVVLDFCRSVWDAYLADQFPDPVGRGKRPKRSRFDQFVTVLLNFYRCWYYDETKVQAFHLNKNRYKFHKTKNGLNLSEIMIPIFRHRMVEVGLLYKSLVKDPETGRVLKGAVITPNNPTARRVTRFWPTQKLIDLFRSVEFSIYDIDFDHNRQTVVVTQKFKKTVINRKTGKKKEVKFTEEVNYDDESVIRKFVKRYPNEPRPDLSKWREDLRAYNRLLKYSFIDSGTQERPSFTVPEKNRWGNPKLDNETGAQKFGTVRIGFDTKYVRRTFSREALEYNGRLNGGWWQRISEDNRTTILIDDWETVEVDFSGMHPSILYAMEDVIPPEGDYYEIAPLFEDVTPKQQRKALKFLVLVAINAVTTKDAFGAFSDGKNSRGIHRSYPHSELQLLLDAFIGKHPLLADSLGSDKGITCMRHDSNICMSVINHFTERRVPVLSVHDSMIIRYDQTNSLRDKMREAFSQIFPDCKFVPKLDSGETGEDELKHLPPIERFGKLKKTTRSDGYKRRFERFVKWKAGVSKQVV